MPGISLIYEKNLDSDFVTNSLADLRHEQNYTIRKIYETPNFMAAFTGYEGYPSQSFEDDSTVYFMEGLIYNKSDSEIAGLLKAVSEAYIGGNDYQTLVKEFVDSSDGDFQVLIYFKKLDESIIFNDRWGRLPAYYYHDDDMFVFSRELKYILKFMPSLQIDKMSLADFLVFQYIPGDRTLFNDIYRVNPSCSLNLKQHDSNFIINMEKVLDVNFEQSTRTLSERECLEKCRELFLQAISNRVNKLGEKKYHLMVDLSGGYDTRAVSAGLRKINAKVEFYTDPIMDYESEYVDKLAALYDIKPITIETHHDLNVSAMGAISFITDCTIDVQTALLAYEESASRAKLVRKVSARFMGFGGEGLRNVYKGVKGYESITDMMKDGLFLSCIPIKQVCSILNLNEEHYYGHLTEYFSQYPETTLRDKLKHLYWDFTSHWDIAGEDRHRLHVWTVPPLWAKDFVEFIMISIPIKYNSFAFNRKFIGAIDPTVLQVPFYIYHTNLKSKISLYRAALIRYLRTRMKNILSGQKNLFKLATKIDLYLKRRSDTGGAENSDYYKKAKQELLTGYANLKALSSFFNEKATLEMLDKYSETNRYQLLSVLLYFKEIEDRYGDKIVGRSR